MAGAFVGTPAYVSARGNAGYVASPVSTSYSQVVASNSLVVVCVALGALRTEQPDVTGVTYNGTSMTMASDRDAPATTANVRVRSKVFYLYLGTTTATSVTVSATINGLCKNVQMQVIQLSGMANRAPEWQSTYSGAYDIATYSGLSISLEASVRAPQSVLLGFMALSNSGATYLPGQKLYTEQTTIARTSEQYSTGVGPCVGFSILGEVVANPNATVDEDLVGWNASVWTESVNAIHRLAFAPSEYPTASWLTITSPACAYDAYMNFVAAADGVDFLELSGTYTGPAPVSLSRRIYDEAGTTLVVGSGSGYGVASQTITPNGGGDGGTWYAKMRLDSTTLRRRVTIGMNYTSAETIWNTTEKTGAGLRGHYLLVVGGDFMRKFFTGTEDLVAASWPGAATDYFKYSGTTASAFTASNSGYAPTLAYQMVNAAFTAVAGSKIGIIDGTTAGATLSDWTNSGSAAISKLASLATHFAGAKIAGVVLGIGYDDAIAGTLTNSASTLSSYQTALTTIRTALNDANMPIMLMRVPRDGLGTASQLTYVRHAEASLDRLYRSYGTPPLATVYDLSCVAMDGTGRWISPDFTTQPHLGIDSFPGAFEWLTGSSVAAPSPWRITKVSTFQLSAIIEVELQGSFWSGFTAQNAINSTLGEFTARDDSGNLPLTGVFLRAGPTATQYLIELDFSRLAVGTVYVSHRAGANPGLTSVLTFDRNFDTTVDTYLPPFGDLAGDYDTIIDVLPISGGTSADWTVVGAANAAAALNEAVPSDTQYITTYQQQGTLNLPLATGTTDPLVSSGHSILIKHSTNRPICVTLLQGSTVICVFGACAPVDGYSEYVLSAAETDAITDYSALTLRIT